MIRELGNRLRSSSSVSLETGPLQEKDFKLVEGWSNGFDKYNQLVTNQVSKDRSYPPADFGKICKTLTKQCGGNFVHGLPESVWDLALLWCPAERMHRKPVDAMEPSWSWLGWEGAVNYPFDPINCPDIRKVEGDYFRTEIANFKIGPESAPYTIRQARKEKLRIDYHFNSHPPRGVEPPSDESNTLRFNALTISAEGFGLEQLTMEDGAEIPCTELLDGEDKKCGVLMDYKDLISAHVAEPCKFEFILLSRNRHCEPDANTRRPAATTAHPPGTPIWNGERFIWNQHVVDFDETVYPEGEWKLLNVMLIQHMKEGYAERVAIGRIHEDAWKARNPVKQPIVLK
jgi:hypothetical protein